MTKAPDTIHVRHGFGLGDPRALFAGAVELAGAAIAATRPDQMTLPTPCDHFDVRALVGHLHAVILRVAVVGRGGNVYDAPEIVTGVADDAWTSAWSATWAEAADVWRDDAMLTRMFTLPWAQIPGAGLMAMYSNELSVHTWDLATATGQRPRWRDDILQFAFDAMHHALPQSGRLALFEQARANMPEELRRMDPPFGEAVPISEDAPLIERLVAWNGRLPTR